MPFYEYRCEACGQEFEKRMRFDQSEELPPCPHCESSRTKKKLSLFASGNTGGGSTSGSGGCGSGSSGGFT